MGDMYWKWGWGYNIKVGMEQIVQRGLKLFSAPQVLFGKEKTEGTELKTNHWMEAGVIAFSKPQSEIERLGIMMKMLQQRNMGSVE